MFARDHDPAGTTDSWVDDFSKLGVKDWADEFGAQYAEGAFGDGTSSEWVDSYEQYVTLNEFSFFIR